MQRASLVRGKQNNNKHSGVEWNCTAVAWQRPSSLLEQTGAQVLHLVRGGGPDVHLLIDLTNLMHMWLLLIKLVYI